jgi:hypothetical protein
VVMLCGLNGYVIQRSPRRTFKHFLVCLHRLATAHKRLPPFITLGVIRGQVFGYGW